MFPRARWPFLALALEPAIHLDREEDEAFLRVWNATRASLLAALPVTGEAIVEPRIEYQRVLRPAETGRRSGRTRGTYAEDDCAGPEEDTFPVSVCRARMEPMLRRALLLLVPLGLVAWLVRGVLTTSEPRNVTTAPAGMGLPSTSAQAADALASVPPTAEREAVTQDVVAPVRVRVATRASYAKEAKPVGGMAFELFAPRGDPPRPPPGNLWPPLALAAGEARLALGRTDSDGVALLELPRAAFTSSGATLRLAGRVCEPGYQANTIERLLPGNAAEFELTLVARLGATARGTVVDDAGVPVVAQVRLRFDRFQNSGPLARLLGGGAFELDFDDTFADAVLLADAGEHGTGACGGPLGFRLSPEAPPQDLRIVVSGSGILRGQLVDDLGRPAAGVSLVTLAAGLDDGHGTTAQQEPLHRELQALGGGAVYRECQSDAEGRFELRGLRDLPFVVRARIRSGSGFSLLLTPIPVLPAGQELRLLLARPHLVVRLLDPEGEAWARAGVEAALAESLFHDAPSKWPAEPRVFVHPCARDASEVELVGQFVAGRRVRADELVFEVPDDARYLVGAYGGGFDGSAQVVEVPSGASGVPVLLRASVGDARGTLVLRVSSGGKLIDPGSLELGVESVPHGLLLLTPERASMATSFSLPPGRYRLFAAGVGQTDFQHGILWQARVGGRAELELDLAAGETQEHTLELEPGARLDVTLVGETRPEDVANLVARSPYLALPENADALARAAAASELVLVRPGRRPEPVYFRAHAFEGTSAAGEHLIAGWPLGASQRSEELPSGRFTLVARLPGGRELRREVELFPGVTTPLTLEF